MILALKIVGGVIWVLCVLFLILFFWGLHEESKRLKKMACAIMRLPPDTPFKVFERMHRGMREQQMGD